MATPPRTLPKGATILVTGANGFIGSHVVNALLAEGYKVRGTVRADKPWLNEYFGSEYGSGLFETIVVPTLEDEGALETAMRGVEGAIHVASDLSYRPDPQAIIPTMISAMHSIMRVCARTDSVKRVVVTSSLTAAFPFMLDGTGEVDMVVDQTTWNDASVKEAWDPNLPDAMKPATVYTASKVEVERGAYNWVAEFKPHFVLNTVLLNMNVGRLLFPDKQFSSMGFLRLLLSGNNAMMEIVPRQWYVDVEDSARLHVVALLDPDVASERIFAAAHPFSWADVIRHLRALRPENEKIPDAPANEGTSVIEIKPTQRAEQLLQTFYGQKAWTSLEESLAAGIADLE